MLKRLEFIALFIISISQIVNCSDSPDRKKQMEEFGDKLQLWRGISSSQTQQSQKTKLTSADDWMALRMQTSSPIDNNSLSKPVPNSGVQQRLQQSSPPAYVTAIVSHIGNENSSSVNNTTKH